MGIEFYNVKLKKKVEVPEDQIQKKKFDITTKTGKKMVRFGIVTEQDGTKLTKFVSQSDWEGLDVPEVS